MGGRTDSTAELVARLSGTNLPIPITIRSPNNLMVIIFLSDSTVQETGFSAKWIAGKKCARVVFVKCNPWCFCYELLLCKYIFNTILWAICISWYKATEPINKTYVYSSTNLCLMGHSLSLCPTETGVTDGDIRLKAAADTQILQSFPEFVSYRDGGDRWRH